MARRTGTGWGRPSRPLTTSPRPRRTPASGSCAGPEPPSRRCSRRRPRGELAWPQGKPVWVAISIVVPLCTRRHRRGSRTAVSSRWEETDQGTSLRSDERLRSPDSPFTIPGSGVQLHRNVHWCPPSGDGRLLWYQKKVVRPPALAEPPPAQTVLPARNGTDARKRRSRNWTLRFVPSRPKAARCLSDTSSIGARTPGCRSHSRNPNAGTAQSNADAPRSGARRRCRTAG